jgi:hypothetical protein
MDDDELSIDELGQLAEALDDLESGRHRPIDDIRDELGWRKVLDEVDSGLVH